MECVQGQNGSKIQACNLIHLCYLWRGVIHEEIQGEIEIANILSLHLEMILHSRTWKEMV